MNSYDFGKYTNIERWSSYWHQLDEILSCGPKSVLEIGVGDKAVGSYLRANFADLQYKSLDQDARLNPDIVGTVESLPLPDGSFDVVCAFEVLEHLPFEKFPIALKEIRRVAREHAIISLPHWGRHFSLQARLPYFGKLGWQHKFNPWPKAHQPGGEHFWEIGKKGYSLERIKEAITLSGLEITKDYIAFESPYHHFFILKIKP